VPDYRTDPTQRDNDAKFWVGYGKYREGKYYDEVKEDPDSLAGWCFALSEGKEHPKPLWQSKTFYLGVTVIFLALYGGSNTDWITQNPDLVAGLAAIVGVLEIGIRTITKGPIQ